MHGQSPLRINKEAPKLAADERPPSQLASSGRSPQEELLFDSIARGRMAEQTIQTLGVPLIGIKPLRVCAIWTPSATGRITDRSVMEI